MAPPPSMLLTLHAVRLLGFTGTAPAARRFAQHPDDVERLLIDAGAQGWAVRSSFGGTTGWSLTVAGRTENERLLTEELDNAGGFAVVTGVLADFARVNAQVVAACSKLQLEGLSAGHRPDTGTDQATHQAFTQALPASQQFEARLTSALPRFGGYTARLQNALENAALDAAWLTATDRDSFHRIWFELHEDLIATLGIRR